MFVDIVVKSFYVGFTRVIFADFNPISTHHCPFLFPTPSHRTSVLRTLPIKLFQSHSIITCTSESLILCGFRPTVADRGVYFHLNSNTTTLAGVLGLSQQLFCLEIKIQEHLRQHINDDEASTIRRVPYITSKLSHRIFVSCLLETNWPATYTCFPAKGLPWIPWNSRHGLRSYDKLTVN